MTRSRASASGTSCWSVRGDVEVVVHGGVCVAAAVRQFHVAAAHFPQVVPGRQGQGGDADIALRPQLYKGRALVLAGFGKRVLERSAAVAHRVPPHLLRAVQVAQCHIVEAVEEGRRPHSPARPPRVPRSHRRRPRLRTDGPPRRCGGQGRGVQRRSTQPSASLYVSMGSSGYTWRTTAGFRKGSR